MRLYGNSDLIVKKKNENTDILHNQEVKKKKKNLKGTMETQRWTVYYGYGCWNSKRVQREGAKEGGGGRHKKFITMEEAY